MKPGITLSKRSPLVGAANAALPALWATGALRRREIDGDAIIAEVTGKTGLSDFGDSWFRGPLEVLISALHSEAALNPVGEIGAAGQLAKVLKDRLFAQHIVSEHPEILERSLARPIIVVGPMRSGTTRLHRLFAADTRFSHMRSFETINPVPSPGYRPGDRDRRWMVAKLAMGAIHTFNPNTAVIHPSGPFEPEEELGLLVRSIWGMKHEAQWQVPSYGRWAEKQDAAPAYRYMAMLLRLIGWARGEDDSRPWVLKTPQHMLDLPALLEVFPDARIIFTHRDPCAVVGSSCSLVWNQMIIHSDEVEANAIGKEWLRKTELQISRMRKARLAIPANRRMDVRYGDMERDWQAVMADIYRFLDMDIAPALPAMTGYMTDAGKELNRHPHRYDLSAFGIEAEDVAARFETYTSAFGLRSGDQLPSESSAAKDHALANRPLVGQTVDWHERKPAHAAAGRN